MAEKLDYERDISIDEQALDVEWLQQASLMRKYATHAATTKKEVDEGKERLEICKARLDMDVRKTPEKYGLGKLTESAIQSVILLESEYQKLNQEHIDARYENDVATAVVRAIDQKKAALENLVRLLGASYFAGPQAPRDLSRECLQERERKEQNAKVKIRRSSKEA